MAIKTNQIVSIEYEVSDGSSVVDSNVGDEPLVFMFGKGQIIPGLEEGIKNMSIGDKAEVKVSAHDAYGEYNPDAMQEVPKDQFAGIDLEIGMALYGQGEEGETVQVIVKEIGEENIIIDFNHPLAGKDLVFVVSINNIREASTQELMTGVPAENEHEGHCGTGGGTGCGCN